MRHKPTIVILNNKFAMFIPFGSIIFGPGLVRTHLVLPDSHLVAMNMGTISRMLTTD